MEIEEGALLLMGSAEHQNGKPASGPASLWEVFSGLVTSCGAKLFDMEVPTSRFGTIRIFITRDAQLNVQPAADEVKSSGSPGTPDSTASVAGVTLELCARVSKRLSAFMESSDGVELGLADSDWALEVSSPGINRTLRRLEHFSGAVGERMRVRFSKSESVILKDLSESSNKSGESERIRTKGLIAGTLVSFEDGILVLEDDSKVVQARIPLREVRDARIDFLFKE